MLHLKYRPKNFAEIIGHKTIIESIAYSFNKNTIPHAILLAGPSGTGKTTIARIIAKKLNADDSEIIEINIANSTGIDFIRQLNDTAIVSPMMGTNKVFILDEIQQISKEGMNCLLKMLEDSPKYSYFVLCTTDPQKLIKPLKDRCNLYTLKSLSDNEIGDLIRYVSIQEKIILTPEIEELLIYKAEGCPRRALVNLSQIQNSVKDFEKCVSLLADDLENERDIIDLVKAIINKKVSWSELIAIYNNINVEPETIRITFANYLSGCLKNAKNQQSMDKFSNLLSLFLSPLTYGSGKAEIIYIIYRAWVGL